eukprot:6793160-Prymnesium_polylepis.1
MPTDGSAHSWLARSRAAPVFSSQAIALELVRPKPTVTASEASLLSLNLTNFSRTRFAFNPFVTADGKHALYNVRLGSSRNSSGLPGIANTKVVWIRRTAGRPMVLHTIFDAEDARAVRFRDAWFAIFVRYRAHSRKDVWLARLQEPYKEIKLTYSRRRKSEGNWLPFVYNDQLYVSYSLCPHTVLAVDVHTGSCTLAHETRHAGCSNFDCGSAAGFLDGNGSTVIGLGHQKMGLGRFYFHFFFRRNALPPFEIQERS